MKRSSLLFAVLLLPFIMFSQLKFSFDSKSVAKKGEGYFLDKKDVKHEGKLVLKMTTVGSFYKFSQAKLAIKDSEGNKNKLSLEEIKQIVIEEDTFTVVADYKIQMKDDLGHKRTIVIPFDFIQVVRRGKITLSKHLYKMAAREISTKDFRYEKEGKSFTLFNGVNDHEGFKVFNLLKDKPAVYKKWKGMKRKELRSNYKLNPYQMIDDYNAAWK